MHYNLIADDLGKTNSTDRIKKLIPSRATEFTERLQPELSTILTGRLSQKQASATPENTKLQKTTRKPVSV